MALLSNNVPEFTNESAVMEFPAVVSVPVMLLTVVAVKAPPSVVRCKMTVGNLMVIGVNTAA